MKKCFKCGETKSLEAFLKSRKARDGRQYMCAECSRLMRVKATEKDNENREKNKEKWIDSIKLSLYQSAMKRAQENNIEFTISLSDITLPDYCPIINERLERNKGQLKDNSYTLDRKDNTKGYIPGNVFVISWLANNTKSRLTVEQVERLLAYVKE